MGGDASGPPAPLVLAIDGPAASGKGTLARRLAGHFRLPHLDTGLLYRATARALIDAGTPLQDAGRAAAAASALDAGGLDESRLRGAEMGEAASVVAALPEVRAALVELQRRFAARAEGAVLDGREAASVVAALPEVRAALVELQRRFAARAEGAVLDGRDIGTVICPDATVKLFVTASAEVRAGRRHRELREKGEAPAFETVLADIRRRDARDAGRADAPLKAAADAVILDTSAMTVEEALAAAITAVRARTGG